MENNLFNYNKENESINIRAEVEKYIVHWKWFFLSVTICILTAFIYIKTQVSIYDTKSSILIKEQGGSASELQAFQDLTLGLGASNNVLDEIEIIKSRTLIIECIKKLNLNYEVYKNIGLKEVEQFSNIPLKYQLISSADNSYKLDTFIDITILDQYKFDYEVEESNEVKTAKFGEKINIGQYSLIFTPEFSDLSNYQGENYQFKFRKLQSVLNMYKGSLEVNSIDDQSNIITISLKHPVSKKAQLVLNTLIDLYNQKSVEDKNQVGEKTDEFITRRLDVIKEELDEIDRLEEVYKKDKQITDIAVQSKVFVDEKSVNEEEIFKNTIELRLVNFMIDGINNQKDEFELLPANIGGKENTQISVSVVQYNQLLIERNRLLRDSSPTNPVVQNLNSELMNLRSNIFKSLINVKDQLELALRSLTDKEKEINSQISSMPKQIREYRSILRRQEIIAQLYSYLLQKKEENKISMAITVSNSKVIDRAYTSDIPVAPKKKIIALLALILGVIIPFVIIYLKDLLDTKFHTKGDLKGVVTVPLLGDIPFDDTEEKVVIRKGSRTSTAEAFRLLRTNLDFMLTPVGTKSKIIFVTSTISGEGKTFVSVNTAASLALTGKKVLLMGMDLRAPKITQYLDLPNRNGVTNYIIDKQANLAEMVTPLAGFENLDLLSSGVVPPNPAELLLSPKIGEMFEELRKMYDYIVVDTAPVNLVTDTLMLSQHADMFLYVSRANYLDKRMLEVPERLYREKRLPNMAILINGLDHSRGYGYGYGGYGYPAEENNKNFFQKIFKS